MLVFIGLAMAGTPDGTDSSKLPLAIDSRRVAELCRRWRITQLSLFGSVLRPDFRPDSDVDVLLTFSPDARWTLLDITRLQDELELILGRSVDVVEEKSLRNPFRRREILRTRQVLYAA
jgi:hypothetical protein